MVIVLAAHTAVTPAGNPVAVPILVAPVVVCVIFVKAVLTQRVGELEAAPAVQEITTIRSTYPLPTLTVPR
jgi:hypothetical protein